MKRLSGSLLLLALLVAVLKAETYPSLRPKNPVSMAMGGCFTAISTGEFSFFGNPAAFALPKGSLTLISTDAWTYLKPTTANLQTFAKYFPTALSDVNSLSKIASLMQDEGGVGGGASLGMGYAGKGLGLGLFAITDEFAAGSSIPEAVLGSDTELNAVIGLGVPIKLFGSTLSIGGDLRPFYRVRADSPLASILNSLVPSSSGAQSSSVADTVDVQAGFGLAVDLGASLRLGSFGMGLAVRDIAPSFPVWSGSFKELLDSLNNGGLPSTNSSSQSATLTPEVTAGLSWKPRLWPGLVEPALYLELQDPVAVVKDWEGFGSALNLLHTGAELKLLNFISLRGGINRGWISAGAGLTVLGLDLNAAVFTEELGALPGDCPRSGLAVQAAIRF